MPTTYEELVQEYDKDWKLRPREDSPYHAQLTEAGYQKVLQHWGEERLVLEEIKHYTVKEDGASAWLPFPNVPALSSIHVLCYTWIIVQPSFVKRFGGVSFTMIGFALGS